MPPRRRRRTSAHQYSLEVDTVLKHRTLAGMVHFFGSEEATRDAWERFKDVCRTNPGFRPEAWWLFEPGIPKKLREIPDLGGVIIEPFGIPVIDTEGPSAPGIKKWREFRAARAAYLAERFGEPNVFARSSDG